MEGFGGVREDFELASLLDGEPLEVSQVGGHCVCAFGEVQDESCGCVLCGLESSEEMPV